MTHMFQWSSFKTSLANPQTSGGSMVQWVWVAQVVFVPDWGDDCTAPVPHCDDSPKTRGKAFESEALGGGGAGMSCLGLVSKLSPSLFPLKEQTPPPSRTNKQTDKLCLADHIRDQRK